MKRVVRHVAGGCDETRVATYMQGVCRDLRANRTYEIGGNMQVHSSDIDAASATAFYFASFYLCGVNCMKRCDDSVRL